MRGAEREIETQREKHAPCREPNEPNAGLDPRSPGSGPGLKAGAKLLSHPGTPLIIFLIIITGFLLDPKLFSPCFSCRHWIPMFAPVSVSWFC